MTCCLHDHGGSVWSLITSKDFYALACWTAKFSSDKVEGILKSFHEFMVRKMATIKHSLVSVLAGLFTLSVDISNIAIGFNAINL